MQRKVAQFSREARNIKEEKPQILTHEESLFIVRMILSECAELLSIFKEPVKDLEDCLRKIDPPKEFEKFGLSNIIAEQADAFVDIMYYILDTASKKGINLEPIFELVHQANMSKKFPDGQFHLRSDGKIMKPEGWKEPDVKSLMAMDFISLFLKEKNFYSDRKR